MQCASRVRWASPRKDARGPPARYIIASPRFTQRVPVGCSCQLMKIEASDCVVRDSAELYAAYISQSPSRRAVSGLSTVFQDQRWTTASWASGAIGSSGQRLPVCLANGSSRSVEARSFLWEMSKFGHGFGKDKNLGTDAFCRFFLFHMDALIVVGHPLLRCMPRFRSPSLRHILCLQGNGVGITVFASDFKWGKCNKLSCPRYVSTGKIVK